MYCKLIQIMIIFMTLCSCTGCNKNQKLTGTVRFTDGEPLTVGTVVFDDGRFLARSFIQKDGRFDVGVLKDGDGIPPGRYKVFITDAYESVIDPKNPKGESFRLLIDRKFAFKDQTPLEIEIPGEKTFNIIVERPPTK